MWKNPHPGGAWLTGAAPGFGLNPTGSVDLGGSVQRWSACLYDSGVPYADIVIGSGGDSLGRGSGVAAGRRLVEVSGTAYHHVPGNPASGGCGGGRHARGGERVRQGSPIAAERVYALAGKGGMRAAMPERGAGVRGGLPGAQHHRQMVPRQGLRRVRAANRGNRLDRQPSRLADGRSSKCRVAADSGRSVSWDAGGRVAAL